MMNETHTIHNQNCTTYSFKRMSWSAVFTGALVAVGLGFLLTLFTIALGLSAFTVDQDGAYAIAIGGLLGMFIATIVSMSVAGYVSGYLGRLFCPKRNLGILYGFTTWSVALLLSALAASPISHYSLTYSNVMLGGTQSVTSMHPAKMAQNENTSPKTRENVQARTAETSTPDAVASSAFIVFALFFIGAISCCFGACYGMKNHREDE